ncbi:MAG: head-tail connector protein [Hyphomonadaceae bacterium]|nr:head-tail connector protein [Hyphomonadaceae bacterium]
MPLVLTSGPAVEPVSLAEAKAHLRVDGTAEDTLIASLIVTSRLHVEAVMGLALVTQGWAYFLDAWARGRALELPLRPVRSITAVRLYDENAVATTLAPASYVLDGAGTPARLVRQGARLWPKPGRTANGIEVAFTAGYGDAAADVPAPIRQALLLLIAHWYEHRTPFEVGALAEPAPDEVSRLLSPYRALRL